MPSHRDVGEAAQAGVPQNHQAWTNLFVALGIISEEDKAFCHVTSRDGQLSIVVDGEVLDQAPRKLRVQQNYERLRASLNITSQLSHTLVDDASDAQQPVEQVPDGVEIKSGLGFMVCLFGDVSKLSGGGVQINWQDDYDDCLAKGSNKKIYVSREPIPEGLFRDIFLKVIFPRLVNAICAASPSTIRRCLVTDETLDLSGTASTVVANPMQREIVERCFGLLPDGTVYIDYNLLLNLCFLPPMRDLMLPQDEVVAFLNQHVPAKTVIDDGFDAILLPPSFSRVAQKKVVVILADNTASMSSYAADYRATLKKLIKDSVAALNSDEDKVFLVTFGGPGLGQVLGSLDSFDRQTTPADIDTYVEEMALDEDGTPLYSAVQRTMQHQDLQAYIGEPNCQVSLIMCTDGQAQSELEGAEGDLQRYLEQPGVRQQFHTFAVGISPQHAAVFCQWLASKTGGAYVNATKPEDMEKVAEYFAEIQSLRDLFTIALGGGEGATIAVYEDPVMHPLPGAQIGMEVIINGRTYKIGEVPRQEQAPATAQSAVSQAPNAAFGFADGGQGGDDHSRGKSATGPTSASGTDRPTCVTM